jgi:hypothetical protein
MAMREVRQMLWLAVAAAALTWLGLTAAIDAADIVAARGLHSTTRI